MDPGQHTDLFDTQFTPNPNPMDPSLYNAVKDGKVEHLDQYAYLFDTQLTPNHNTILHVAAHFGKSDCVAKILENKPLLLLQVNSNCENTLHIAVREQHYGVVQALIHGAKEDLDPESGGGTRLEMLRAINVDGDMPLHLAVREGDNSFVSLLANMDRDFLHPPNKAGETPLYLAAEREHDDSMVESILASCKSPAYTGPSGRTALHAAATNGNSESLKKLLDRYKELIDKADTKGWTPLHYAAACGRERGPVEELLKRNKLVGYTRTSEKHDKSTALHLAVARNKRQVMEEILSHCPDCWEMVNSKGRNILHIAIDAEAEDVVKYIIKKEGLESLMNQKDFEGNTPLHLLASSEMKYTDLINHRRANMYAFNNQNWTPAEVANTANKDLWSSKPRGKRNVAKKKAQENRRQGLKRIKEEKEKEKDEKFTVKEAEYEVMKKTAESHMLVATLIATITFAAAFAIPGGYNGNQGPEEGMAVLVRQASFKAFVIANTIAVMCSTSSVIYYVFAALYPSGDEEQVRRYEKGFYLVIIAIMAMTIGFISGTYAMLVHSLGIAIATSVIASITFLIHFVELFRLLRSLAAMWLLSILCACCFGYVRVSPYRYASLRRRI